MERLRWGALGAARSNRKVIPSLRASRNGEVVGTEGRLYLDNPFSLMGEDSVIEEHHYGRNTVTHNVQGRNPFVRMAEHFAGSVLNGTTLRYTVADAANNLRALAGAAERTEGAAR